MKKKMSPLGEAEWKIQVTIFLATSFDSIFISKQKVIKASCSSCTPFLHLFADLSFITLILMIIISVQKNQLNCKSICSILFFLLSYYCCIGVHHDITKVFTIYHSWANPLHRPLFPLPHSWNSFMSHFSIFKHKYILFPLPSPSCTIFLYSPPSHWCQPLDRTCFTFFFLFFFF
jgi:hypothetical protein